MREALADSFDVTYALGCRVVGGDDADIAAAVGPHGRGGLRRGPGRRGRPVRQRHVGRGQRRHDLTLPGRQEELLESVLGTGTPVVAVLLVGRPYDLSRQADRLAGLVCGFFPGEEGAQAIADVLSGRVNPSGRLPVSFPGAGSTQPPTYLGPAAREAHRGEVVDPTPLFPSVTACPTPPRRGGLATPRPDGGTPTARCELVVELANEADRAVSEVVQVYLHDRVAPVVRPVQQLIGAARVDLGAGGAAQVRFDLHADLTSFTGRELVRIVEPASSAPGRRVERGHPRGRRARARGPGPRGRSRPGARATRHVVTWLMHYDWPLDQLRDYAPDLPGRADLDEFWSATLPTARVQVRRTCASTPGLLAVETYDVTF